MLSMESHFLKDKFVIETIFIYLTVKAIALHIFFGAASSNDDVEGHGLSDCLIGLQQILCCY